jgi:hypothetical protein
MRQEAVLNKFTTFFKGETSGRLFVFYQEEVADGEVRFQQLLNLFTISM